MHFSVILRAAKRSRRIHVPVNAGPCDFAQGDDDEWSVLWLILHNHPAIGPLSMQDNEGKTTVASVMHATAACRRRAKISPPALGGVGWSGCCVRPLAVWAEGPNQRQPGAALRPALASQCKNYPNQRSLMQYPGQPHQPQYKKPPTKTETPEHMPGRFCC